MSFRSSPRSPAPHVERLEQGISLNCCACSLPSAAGPGSPRAGRRRPVRRTGPPGRCIAALIPASGALVARRPHSEHPRHFERQAGNILQRLQRDPERGHLLTPTPTGRSPARTLGRRRLLRLLAIRFPPARNRAGSSGSPRGSAPHPLGRQAGKAVDHRPLRPAADPRLVRTPGEEWSAATSTPWAKPTWRSPKSCAWT